jgi:uncharacterized protein YndB with AHSA1/START domain
MPAEVEARTEIAAPAETVWSLVSDVTRMGEWSPETVACRWLTDPPGPRVGAAFVGTNRRTWRRWSTVCRIIAAERGRELAFDVRYLKLFGISTWRYRFEPTPDGCAVTESWTDRRGGFIRWSTGLLVGVPDRAEHNRQMMVTTLGRLKAAAEAGVSDRAG